MSEKQELAIEIVDDYEASDVAASLVWDSVEFQFSYNSHHWFTFDLQDLQRVQRSLSNVNVEPAWWRRDSTGNLVPMDRPVVPCPVE